MFRYSYIRVSGKDQNIDRQILAMKNLDVKIDKIFCDKQSGKDFDRPQYIKMLKKLKENDIIYIKSIDRLGRNYVDILEQWKIITHDKKANIVVLDMPLLDTFENKDLIGKFMSDIVLQILSFVSENERINIKQRQKEGIEAAKIKGVKFGRPEKEIPNIVFEKYINKDYRIDMICEDYGIGKSTFYRKLKTYKETTL